MFTLIHPIEDPSSSVMPLIENLASLQGGISEQELMEFRNCDMYKDLTSLINKCYVSGNEIIVNLDTAIISSNDDKYQVRLDEKTILYISKEEYESIKTKLIEHGLLL